MQITTDVICIDQISHPISNDRRELFYKYAKANTVIQKFKNIVIGEIGNFTEKKPVTHFEYKRGTKKNFVEDQRNVLSITEKIKRNFKRVVIFSIGGSNLGPSLMNDIFNMNDLEIIFITGSDPDEFSSIQIREDDASSSRIWILENSSGSLPVMKIISKSFILKISFISDGPRFDPPILKITTLLKFLLIFSVIDKTFL